MNKKLTRPHWYSAEYYEKPRTPEEWLCDLWKRYQFNLGEVGQPKPFHELPIKEQENYFLELLSDSKHKSFLDYIEPIPPQPVKYPTVSDIALMYFQMMDSDKYRNNPNREPFERAIFSIVKEDGSSISKDEKMAFLEMQKIPWCFFYENHEEENWCPIVEMKYLSGIPLTIDPCYSKQDSIKILNKKLSSWIGKRQEIQLHFESWQESKLLAVFDLKAWFKMHQIEYTNISLHKLIWRNGRVSAITGEEVNPYDDIDHSILLANRVIDLSPIHSLRRYCEARKYKKESQVV